MYFFIKLLCVCFLTLLLLVAELVVEHFTHCLTLLVVAWQTMYRFISLFISCVSLALSHNNSKSLEQKVITRNPKYCTCLFGVITCMRWIPHTCKLPVGCLLNMYFVISFSSFWIRMIVYTPPRILILRFCTKSTAHKDSPLWISQ